MTRWIVSAVLIGLVMVMALLALADSPASGARALPTQPNPYVDSLREGVPIDPTTRPSATPVPTVRAAGGSPAPRHAVGSPLLAGWATTYDDGPGLYASAGPDVRRIMPWYHHGVVMVCAFPNGRSNCSAIPTVGWCACGFRHGIPTLLDLSPDAYALLCQAPAGVCKVTVEVLGGAP